MSTVPGRPINVLVVDDHEDSAHLLAKLLRREGHRATTAHTSAGAAIVAAGIATLDLLVSDIGLPDGNGCDLLRHLNDRVGGGPAHAIALTGHGEEHWVEKCRRAGYSHFLLKPVKFEDLLAAVNAVSAAEVPPSVGGVPAPARGR